MEWTNARKHVQQACLDVLVRWRGDDDDDGEMDDILREVIVISDEEDEDEANEGIPHNGKLIDGGTQRNTSVELITLDDINMQSVNYATSPAAGGRNSSLSQDTDSTDDVQYLGAAPLLPTRPTQYDQYKVERLGARRHRMWEEAIDRRQNNSRVPYTAIIRPQSSASPRFDPDHSYFFPPNYQIVTQQPYLGRLEDTSPWQDHRTSHLVALPPSLGQSPRGSGPQDFGRPTYDQQVSGFGQKGKEKLQRIWSTTVLDHKGKLLLIPY